MLKDLSSGTFKIKPINMDKSNSYGNNNGYLMSSMPVVNNGMLEFDCWKKYFDFQDAIKQVDNEWIDEKPFDENKLVEPNEALDAIEAMLGINSFRKAVENKLEHELASGKNPADFDENPTYIKDQYIQSLFNNRLEIKIANTIYVYDAKLNTHSAIVQKPNGQTLAIDERSISYSLANAVGNNGGGNNGDDELCECIGVGIEYHPADPCGNWNNEGNGGGNGNGGGKSNNSICAAGYKNWKLTPNNGCLNTNWTIVFDIVLDSYISPNINYVINWGDGTTTNSSSPVNGASIVTISETHQYPAALGVTYNVSVTATDPIQQPNSTSYTSCGGRSFKSANHPVTTGSISKSCDKSTYLVNYESYEYSPGRMVKYSITQYQGSSSAFIKGVSSTIKHYIKTNSGWAHRDIGRKTAYSLSHWTNSSMVAQQYGKAYLLDCKNEVPVNKVGVCLYNQKEISIGVNPGGASFGTKKNEIQTIFTIKLDGTIYTKILPFTAPNPEC